MLRNAGKMVPLFASGPVCAMAAYNISADMTRSDACTHALVAAALPPWGWGTLVAQVGLRVHDGMLHAWDAVSPPRPPRKR
jgi:hypothetical protein